MINTKRLLLGLRWPNNEKTSATKEEESNKNIMRDRRGNTCSGDGRTGREGLGTAHTQTHSTTRGWLKPKIYFKSAHHSRTARSLSFIMRKVFMAWGTALKNGAVF